MISPRAAICPRCGEPFQKRGEVIGYVSFVWTLLFGWIYFMVKGWWKSALVALLLSCFTGGVAWLIIPFFAKSFVKSIEAWGS